MFEITKILIRRAKNYTIFGFAVYGALTMYNGCSEQPSNIAKEVNKTKIGIEKLVDDFSSIKNDEFNLGKNDYLKPVANIRTTQVYNQPYPNTYNKI